MNLIFARPRAAYVPLLALLLIGTLLLAPASVALAQTQPPTPTDMSRTVSVSGTGQSSTTPDAAILTLGVETQAPDAGAALSQNNEQMAALIETFTGNAVAAEDIQTQAVRLQPQYAQPGVQPEIQPAQPPTGTVSAEITGYIATNTVKVTVRDLTTVGQLLDAAVQAGSNQIYGIDFTVSDPTAALDEARAAAWADAQHKAEQLAELAGATLGEVMSINEFSQTPIPLAQSSAMGAADMVPIQPGLQQLQVNVQISWQLESAE